MNIGLLIYFLDFWTNFSFVAKLNRKSVDSNSQKLKSFFLSVDEFHIIDAILNCGANSENRGSDISLKLRRNIASNHLKFFLLARGGFWLGLCL